MAVIRFFILSKIYCKEQIGASKTQMRYPLRARSWSKKKAHKLCAGLWLFSLSVPALHLHVDKDDVTFHYRVYLYNYQYSSDAGNVLMPITSVLAYLTPNIMIVISRPWFSKTLGRRPGEHKKSTLARQLDFYPHCHDLHSVLPPDNCRSGTNRSAGRGAICSFGKEFYRVCEVVL